MEEKSFGRYVIRREIGQGGMAVVYLAHDPRFQRNVAIKLLPRELTDNANFRGRFEQEATTIAQLEHPAIVPVYDFGEQDGQLYLVMRLMSNSLADRLKAGSLTVDECVRILRPIASALDRAHAQGIIHRDLKPGNILFDRDGNAHLSDFGIAKLSQGSASFTQTGGLVGTPAYMSPEQAEGSQGVDYRTDIYALGAILFEMLTGIVPYQADTPIATALKHITQPVPRLNLYNHELPPACQQVVSRAMAKHREERYQSATELVDALAGVSADGSSLSTEATMVLGGLSTGPTPTTPTGSLGTAEVDTAPRLSTVPPSGPSPASRVQNPSRVVASPQQKPRSRVWLWLLLFVVLVGVGGGGFWYWQSLDGQLPVENPGEQAAIAGEVDSGEENAAPGIESEDSLGGADSTSPTDETSSVQSAEGAVEVTEIPPTDTPTPEPTDTPTPTPLPSPTPTPVPLRSIGEISQPGPGLPLTFENGDQSWIWSGNSGGSARIQSDVIHDGGSALELNYQFVSETDDWLSFGQVNAIDGEPNRLQVWVYGNGSGNLLNVLAQDAEDEIWEIHLGQIFDDGWQQLTGYILPNQPWPSGHVTGPDNGQIDYPLRFLGFVVADYNNLLSQNGTIYIDTLSADVADVSSVPLLSSYTVEVGQGAEGAGFPLDFEQFGVWERVGSGDFTPSTTVVHSGEYAARLSYRFTGDTKYVALRQANPLPSTATQIRAWVFGDGNGNTLIARVSDANGTIWESAFGAVSHFGWDELQAPLSDLAFVRGTETDEPVPPLSFHSFLLQANGTSGNGIVYLDAVSLDE